MSNQRPEAHNLFIYLYLFSSQYKLCEFLLYIKKRMKSHGEGEGEGESMPDMLDMMVIITTMPNDKRFLPETRDSTTRGK